MPFCFQFCVTLSPHVSLHWHKSVQKKKNPVNQNQGREPIHRKYKANENTRRHNPKTKQKQTINKNQVKKTLCKEDSINNDKENIKTKKLSSVTNRLVMQLKDLMQRRLMITK
jgi:hypothetical protein